jgi:hypothetical protein
MGRSLAWISERFWYAENRPKASITRRRLKTRLERFRGFEFIDYVYPGKELIAFQDLPLPDYTCLAYDFWIADCQTG